MTETEPVPDRYSGSHKAADSDPVRRKYWNEGTKISLHSPPGFTVEQLELDQPGEIADVIEALGGAPRAKGAQIV